MSSGAVPLWAWVRSRLCAFPRLYLAAFPRFRCVSCEHHKRLQCFVNPRALELGPIKMILIKCAVNPDSSRSYLRA